ncbi:MAG: YgfZ/GcvT domain-containing protein [Gammaproteobacteria bacterium]
MNIETGIADISAGRARLRVTGDDRTAFLHGQCTNDVKRRRPGESCYAAFLNAKGKMRGDAHIICLDDAFLLEASVGLQPSLEKFIITEDVVIEDVSATFRAWLVIGPPPSLPADALNFSHPLGVGVISATPLTTTLRAEVLEVLRVEAGVPKFGMDMDENTIPNEAGLESRVIDYEKGCYIGQETIARIKTYGHVNRHLVQLAVDGNSVPAPGTKLYSAEKEIGQMTSAVQSVRLGKPLALGYVRREFAKAGTKLKVGDQNAEVLKLCG